MNYRTVFKNYAIAVLAQGVSTFAGIATGFLVPKVLGVTDFGYYQLFVFYTTYVGLCHLGLTDGVYLIVGGTDRAKLDNRSIKSQLLVGIVYELLFALGLMLVGMLGGFEPERAAVLFVLSLYLVVKNIGAYLGYVLQAINETRLFSFSTIVEKGLFVTLVVLLLFSRVNTFLPYIVAFSVGSLGQMLFCAIHVKEILSAELLPMKEALSLVKKSISVGSKLLIANLASSFVLGVARIAIDNAWGIEAFGKVSFSVSMVSFFLSFVTQASMVLFPALRAGGADDAKKFYKMANTVMGLLFPFAYLMYCPLCWFVSAWLPAYADSARYLILLLPICVFDSKMNISCSTLYKVRREESKLLRINLVTVFGCAILVAFSVYIIDSVDFALASATIAIVLRSLFSELDLSRSLGIEGSDISFWEICLTMLFIVLSMLTSKAVTMLIYGAFYLVFVWLHRVDIKRLKIIAKS